MIWAYGIENDTEVLSRNNKPLFMAISKMNVSENNRYFDIDSSDKRTELKRLIVDIQNGDSLVVRSLEDLADSYEDLLTVLEELTEKRIVLTTLKETYISEYGYYDIVKGVQELSRYFYQHKRMTAYRKAVDEGKVGRPSSGNAEKCVALYLNGAITKEEVLSMADISEPTFYRYLRRAKEKV